MITIKSRSLPHPCLVAQIIDKPRIHAFSMDSGLARGSAPWTPGGYIPTANILFIPVSSTLYNSQLNHSITKITSQKKFNKYQFYKSDPVSISLYTTFTVCPLSVIFNDTFSLFPDVHRESPTYNCPCEKTGVLKSNPTCANDCP